MATRRARIGHRLLLKMGLRKVGFSQKFDTDHENYTWLKHYVEEILESLSSYALQLARMTEAARGVGEDARHIYLVRDRGYKPAVAFKDAQDKTHSGYAGHLQQAFVKGVIEPVGEWYRDLESIERLVADFNEIRVQHDHYDLKVKDLKQKATMLEARATTRGDNRDFKQAKQRMERNIKKQKEVTTEFNNKLNTCCNRMKQAWEEREKMMNGIVARIIHFQEAFYAEQLMNCLGVSRLLSEAEGTGPRWGGTMGIEPFVAKGHVRHYEGELLRKHTLIKERMWYRLVGSSLEVYDMKTKDDRQGPPMYVVTEQPVTVHEVKGVTKITDLNFRVVVLGGLDNGAGLNLFAADESDAKGWVDALKRASEWDQLQSTRKVERHVRESRAFLNRCKTAHASSTTTEGLERELGVTEALANPPPPPSDRPDVKSYTTMAAVGGGGGAALVANGGGGGKEATGSKAAGIAPGGEAGADLAAALAAKWKGKKGKGEDGDGEEKIPELVNASEKKKGGGGGGAAAGAGLPPGMTGGSRGVPPMVGLGGIGGSFSGRTGRSVMGAAAAAGVAGGMMGAHMNAPSFSGAGSSFNGSMHSSSSGLGGGSQMGMDPRLQMGMNGGGGPAMAGMPPHFGPQQMGAPPVNPSTGLPMGMRQSGPAIVLPAGMVPSGGGPVNPPVPPGPPLPMMGPWGVAQQQAAGWGGGLPHTRSFGSRFGAKQGVRQEGFRRSSSFGDQQMGMQDDWMNPHGWQQLSPMMEADDFDVQSTRSAPAFGAKAAVHEATAAAAAATAAAGRVAAGLKEKASGKKKDPPPVPVPVVTIQTVHPKKEAAPPAASRAAPTPAAKSPPSGNAATTAAATTAAAAAAAAAIPLSELFVRANDGGLSRYDTSEEASTRARGKPAPTWKRMMSLGSGVSSYRYDEGDMEVSGESKSSADEKFQSDRPKPTSSLQKAGWLKRSKSISSNNGTSPPRASVTSTTATAVAERKPSSSERRSSSTGRGARVATFGRRASGLKDSKALSPMEDMDLDDDFKRAPPISRDETSLGRSTRMKANKKLAASKLEAKAAAKEAAKPAAVAAAAVAASAGIASAPAAATAREDAIKKAGVASSSSPSEGARGADSRVQMKAPSATVVTASDSTARSIASAAPAAAAAAVTTSSPAQALVTSPIGVASVNKVADDTVAAVSSTLSSNGNSGAGGASPPSATGAAAAAAAAAPAKVAAPTSALASTAAAVAVAAVAATAATSPTTAAAAAAAAPAAPTTAAAPAGTTAAAAATRAAPAIEVSSSKAGSSISVKPEADPAAKAEQAASKDAAVDKASVDAATQAAQQKASADAAKYAAERKASADAAKRVDGSTGIMKNPTLEEIMMRSSQSSQADGGGGVTVGGSGGGSNFDLTIPAVASAATTAVATAKGSGDPALDSAALSSAQNPISVSVDGNRAVVGPAELPSDTLGGGCETITPAHFAALTAVTTASAAYSTSSVTAATPRAAASSTAPAASGASGAAVAAATAAVAVAASQDPQIDGAGGDEDTGSSRAVTIMPAPSPDTPGSTGSGPQIAAQAKVFQRLCDSSGSEAETGDDGGGVQGKVSGSHGEESTLSFKQLMGWDEVQELLEYGALKEEELTVLWKEAVRAQEAERSTSGAPRQSAGIWGSSGEDKATSSKDSGDGGSTRSVLTVKGFMILVKLIEELQFEKELEQDNGVGLVPGPVYVV